MLNNLNLVGIEIGTNSITGAIWVDDHPSIAYFKAFPAQELSLETCTSRLSALRSALQNPEEGNHSLAAVVTLPSYVNDSEKDLVRRAATTAGIDILEILTNSMAAAIAYGPYTKDRALAICEVDATAITVSSIKARQDDYEVNSTAKFEGFGNRAIEDALINWFNDRAKNQYNIVIAKDDPSLHCACQLAKMSRETRLSFEFEINGKMFPVNASQTWLKSVIWTALKPMKDLYDKHRLRAHLADDLLFVGDFCQMLALQSVLRTHLFVRPQILTDISPADVAAIGAVIHARRLVGADLSYQKAKDVRERTILKPEQIKQRLDEYVVGQDQAKEALAVAVYNHYKRIRTPTSGDVEKSNVLLLGPTGSGKTLLVRTLAGVLDVPLAMADATSLTQAGIVGEKVEGILLRLVQMANKDISKAELGIVYIDEIDKLRRCSDSLYDRGPGGVGVQQSLLMMVEGTIVDVPPEGIWRMLMLNQPPLKINTKNILFIVAGAFVGIEKITAKRLGKTLIGFDKEASDGIQIADSKRQKILSHVTAQDLIQFGMIPEFVGRFHSFAYCRELGLEDLRTILTEPKNSIIKQFIRLFALDGVDLKFTEDALYSIAQRALDAGTGARGLREILENLMGKLMFQVPSDDTIRRITIDKDVVLGIKPPEIHRHAQVTQKPEAA